ncbi:MAG TPA: cytochrome c3 family protein [Acidobacteriota bacterium]|nr:cytochrome c3 family protein [Acidobacteriota bacterium]
MRTLITIALILGLAGAEAWGSASLEILAPPQYIATKANHIHLVGRTDAPIVEITLNGDAVPGITPHDSVFHALVWFGYGLNEIVVTSTWDDTTVTSICDTVEVLSGPQIDYQYEHVFTPYQFHDEQPRTECTNCHPSPVADSARIPEAEACYRCHRLIKERFHTHIPNDERACIACHDIRGDLTLASTGSGEHQNPCYACHKNKIGQFAQDFIHGPVAGHGCVVCHDSHGSVYEKALHSPAAVLCPSCHDMHAQQTMAVHHEPFERGRCTDCHDPHATNHKWVLIKQSHELCLHCHQGTRALKEHIHPYDVKPRRKPPQQVVLTENGLLECSSCHMAHASNTEHLLRTEDSNTCGGCHPDE